MEDLLAVPVLDDASPWIKPASTRLGHHQMSCPAVRIAVYLITERSNPLEDGKTLMAVSQRGTGEFEHAQCGCSRGVAEKDNHRAAAGQELLVDKYLLPI
jgi:hypothetical protein